MLKNTKDIRVKKTKRAIYRALTELLREKQLNRITIKELADIAEINKGTFYLHYKDIGDLYNKFITEYVENFMDGIDFYELFFDDSNEFLRKLILYYKLRRDEIPVLDQNYSNDILITIAQMMREELYKTGRIEKSKETDISIEFIVYATLGIMLSHEDFDSEAEVVGNVAAKTIRALFEA